MTVSISITDGKDINVEQTIPRIAAGQEETVSIPISEKPDTQGVSNVTIEIAPVPGEGTRDNNRARIRWPSRNKRRRDAVPTFWPPAVGISFKRAR